MIVCTRAVLGVLFALCVATGCATNTPVAPVQAAALRTVAVVSLVPEVGVYQKVGLTVFNNESGVAVAMNGAVRRTIEAATVQRLAASRPELRVRPLDVDAAKLMGNSPFGLRSTSDFERIAKEVAASGRAAGAEAVIVFLPNGPQDNDFRLAMGGDGIGAWERSLPGLPRAAVIHANLEARLVDSQGRQIAHAFVIDRPPLEVRRLDTAATPVRLPPEPALEALLRENMLAVLASNTAVRLRELGL